MTTELDNKLCQNLAFYRPYFVLVVKESYSVRTKVYLQLFTITIYLYNK